MEASSPRGAGPTRILAAMALEITGTLHKLFETQSVTDRFNKREFVLEVPGRHPQLVLFQLTGKRCADLEGFAPGDKVRVEFSLRGREWTSRQGEVKYFNSLEVAKLERTEATPDTEGTPDRAASAGSDLGDDPPF
jgi:hypothetical protein